MNWISVEDKLPEDYREVLYFAIDDMGSKEIMTGHREKGNWTHCCLFYSSFVLNDKVTVTHWMELPGYPKD
jgi:1,2-phenylacetyl-CoA epoxidase catalytic subunit